MEEKVKVPRNTYLVHRIGVPNELLGEFNQFWRKNTLPLWEKNGAKLVVAGTTLVGGLTGEITRIFEFDNIHHWEKMQESTWDWWEREEGPGRGTPPKGYLKYLSTHEQQLLRASYDESVLWGKKVYVRSPGEDEGAQGGKKKAPRKIYLEHRIRVPNELLDEFIQFWRKNTLPMWEENGARLVVAGTNLVGSLSAEITRVFEFDNIHHWEKMQEALWDWWEREEGPGSEVPPRGYLRYLKTHEQKLLRAIY
jgi:hypothetical protein